MCGTVSRVANTLKKLGEYETRHNVHRRRFTRESGSGGFRGCFVFSVHAKIATATKFLGEATNNVAEYTAIIIGLERAHQGITHLVVRMDSELAVRQLNRQYRVRTRNSKTFS